MSACPNFHGLATNRPIIEFQSYIKTTANNFTPAYRIGFLRSYLVIFERLITEKDRIPWQRQMCTSFAKKKVHSLLYFALHNQKTS